MLLLFSKLYSLVIQSGYNILFLEAALLVLHYNRKDLLFIRTCFDYPNWCVFLEYLLLSTPLYISLWMWNFNILAFIGALVIVGIIAVLPVGNNKEYKIYNISLKGRSLLKTILPTSLFEWQAGLRKYPFLFFVYIIGLALSFINYVGFISLFIIVCIISAFYSEAEDLLYVFSYNMDSRRFVHQKLKHIIYYAVFISPLLIVGLLFNIEGIAILITLFFTSMLGLAAIIVSKYACYLPNHNSVEYYVTSIIILVSILWLPLVSNLKYLLSHPCMY